MLIEYIYGKVLLILFVLVCSYVDIKTHKVDTRVFYVTALLAISGYIWMVATGREILYLRIAIGLGGAGIIWLIGYFTKEQIGYGDAAFFTITGLIMGCSNILVIGGSILVAAGIAVVLLAHSAITGKRITNTRIPFLPVAGIAAIAVMFFA